MPSQFHVASKRRWCAEFQSAVDRAMSLRRAGGLALPIAERIAMVNSCLDEFAHEAEQRARGFLERYLGDDDDAHNDADLHSDNSSSQMTTGTCSPQEQQHRGTSGQGAGSRRSSLQTPHERGGPGAFQMGCEWATGAQLQRGEFLTVTVLDCEDNVAAATAQKEQESHMLLLAVQMCFLPHVVVHVAPRCIVQWRGRILLVAAQALLVEEAVKASDCEELAVALSLATDVCHLARYYAPQDEDGGISDDEERYTAGPPGAAARMGGDGRWYVTSLASLFPHFPPARGAAISKRHRLFLRPEAVMSDMFRQRLSPGAFLVYGSKDSTAQNTAARECTQELCQSAVQRVAQRLMDPAFALAEGEHSVLWDGQKLSAFLHRAGVNIGLLGLVLTFIPQETPMRDFVFSEMVSRVCRDYLRSNMCRRVEMDDVTRVVSEFFGEIGRPDSFVALWQDELFQRMTRKFAGYGSFFSEHGTNSPFEWIRRPYVLQRLSQLLGFRFASGVTGEGTSPFHFPIKDLSTVVRRFHLHLPESLQALVIPSCGSHTHAPTLRRASPSWLPSFIYSKFDLFRIGSSGTSSSGDAAGLDVTPRKGETAVTRSVNEWLQSYLAFQSQVQPVGLVVPANTSTYALLLCDAAAFCLAVWRTKCDAKQTEEPLHPCLSAALDFTRTALAVAKKLKFAEDGIVYALVEAQHARCLIASGDSAGGLALLDSAFQHAAAASASVYRRTPRYGGPSSGACSAAIGRSATSSVEVQALSLPIGSMPPPLQQGGMQAVGRQQVSAGGQRTKMAVSIIADDNFHPTEAATSDTQLGGSSLARMASPPDVIDSSRASQRGDHPDAFSVSDMDGPAHLLEGSTRSTHPHSGGFTALAAELATELAEALDAAGQPSSAEAAYRYALSAAVAFFGDVHAAVSTATTNLAVCLYSQGRFEEAEALFREDLRVSELLFGRRHPSVSSSLNNLACLLEGQNRHEESEPLFLQDLEITIEARGKECLDVSTSQNNLGTSYLKRGMFDAAERMFASALDIRVKTCGELSSETADVLFNYGALKRRSGDASSAKALWERCLAAQQAVYGSESTKTLPLLEALCVVCEELSDFARSEELMEIAFRIKQGGLQ